MPETPEVAAMRRNDTRYRIRRWNAFVAARNDGEWDGKFEEFADKYDAVSDAMTLDDEPGDAIPSTNTNSRKQHGGDAER